MTDGGARGRRVRRRRPGWRNADVLRASALVLAVYFLTRLVWFANPLFLTAFLGMLFGLAVASGVDHLQRWRIPRGIGAAIIVMAFFGMLIGFGFWMAPTLRSQSTELQHRLPDAIDRVENWVNGKHGGVVGMVVKGVVGPDTGMKAQVPAAPTTAQAPVAAAAKPDSSAGSALRQRLSQRFSGATKFLFPFLTSTLEIISGILIIVFLSIYIAADPDLYHRGIMHLFPRARRKRAGEVLSAMAAMLRRWLITQLIAMAVIGSVTTVMLLVLRVKAAFALGLLAGLFEFIPTVGPILSSVPAVAMAFLDSPEKALLVAGAYVLIQFMENHLLIPLLMKGGVNVPPALTILSQALMALLFGFIGLMVAVPLLAATLVAVKMLYVENVVGERAIGDGEDPHQGIA
jgi:predicted PurR-regulated permease PerM